MEIYTIQYIVVQLLAIGILIYTIKNFPKEDDAYSYGLFVKGIALFILFTIIGIVFLVNKISWIEL